MKRSLTKVSHQKELVEYHFRSGKKDLANEEYEEAIKHFSLLHKTLYQQRISTRKT
jgi:predicted ATPase